MCSEGNFFLAFKNLPRDDVVEGNGSNWPNLDQSGYDSEIIASLNSSSATSKAPVLTDSWAAGKTYMFFGSHSTRIDDKGRVKLSSDFKAVVDRECGPEFYITSTDGKRAQLFPLKEWIKKQEFLQTISPSNPIRQRYLDVTSRFGSVAEMDTQGRLLIPQILREEAKMAGEVTIVAKNPILEVVITSEFNEDAKPLSRDEMAQAAALGL